jgi:hypothetical protein
MKTIVITVRHPDFSNEHHVFEGDEPGVEITDVDLGSSFDGQADDEEQWDEWSQDILADAGISNWPHEAIQQLHDVLQSAHPDH